MYRYILYLIQTAWFRCFKSGDALEEMKLIYAFNKWCTMTQHDMHYPINRERYAKGVLSIKKLRSYITQRTDPQDKKIDYHSPTDETQVSYGPDVSSIKLRMHYFLLMCLDDV